MSTRGRKVGTAAVVGTIIFCTSSVASAAPTEEPVPVEEAVVAANVLPEEDVMTYNFPLTAEVDMPDQTFSARTDVLDTLAAELAKATCSATMRMTAGYFKGAGQRWTFQTSDVLVIPDPGCPYAMDVAAGAFITDEGVSETTGTTYVSPTVTTTFPNHQIHTEQEVNIFSPPLDVHGAGSSLRYYYEGTLTVASANLKRRACIELTATQGVDKLKPTFVPCTAKILP